MIRSATACLFAVAFFDAHASASPSSELSFPASGEALPAMRYAALDSSACSIELHRRGVAFVDASPAPGILAPIRLTGPLNGVLFRTALPREQRAEALWEVMDCRLSLALYDLANILHTHDVVEVVMFSAWRPPSASWPEGKIGNRHPGGLAIDVQRLRKNNGVWLIFKDHFPNRIGARTCGPKAFPPPPSDEGRELRSIVCEAYDQGMFNVMLTPHFNHAHFNHAHLEVMAGVRWFLLR